MTSMSDQLSADLKTAMRAGEKARVEVIRGARAALQRAQLEAAKQQYDAEAAAIEARLAHDAEARTQALAAIHADAHAPLTLEAEQAVIAKEIKRRLEASELYRKGGRPELADQEEAEATILRGYLPQMLSAEELRPAIRALIADLGLSGPSAMGKLMPALVQRFQGRADGRLLSQLARELLAGA